MSTERDTHFQGFAKLLYSDLANLFLVMYSYSTDEEEQFAMAETVIKDVLARRAYDLVEQGCVAISDEQMRTGARLHPSAMLRVVPDMTAWPEPPSTNG